MKILKKKFSKLQLLWLLKGGKTFEGLNLSRVTNFAKLCLAVML